MSSLQPEHPAPAIPLIDLGPLRDGSPEGLDVVAGGVADACEDKGFLYIGNHGVPRALIERAFEESRRFHALPAEEKLKLHMNEFYRGYVPIGGSTLSKSSIEQAKKPNQSEQIMFRHELAPDDPEVVAGLPLQGPNQWPESLPGFEETIRAYWSAVQGVGFQLLTVLARALDLPLDFFDPYFGRPTTNLKLVHYPPLPGTAEADLYSAAPHTDFGVVTILAQDDVGGLQVRDKSGEWIDAPPIPGTFVVNIGDCLARWTNDRFTSTPHRVRNKSPERDRYSIPFFLDPDMNATIACIPTCRSQDDPPRYAPVRYRDYLMERLGTNFAAARR